MAQRKRKETESATVKKTQDMAEHISTKSTVAVKEPEVTAIDFEPLSQASEAQATAPTVEAAPSKTSTINSSVFIQYMGKDVSVQDTVDAIKSIWVDELGRDILEIKDLRLYFRTEINRAYYVINGEVTGDVEI